MTKKISALTAVTNAAGANEIEVNEAGTSKKASLTQVQAAFAATDAQARAQTATTVNLTPANLAGRASFKATMSASKTDVADATYTKIPFDTETWDVGALYDPATNYRWVPPAGKVAINLAVYCTGTWVAGALTILVIYKNGAAVANSSPIYAQLANDSVLRCLYFDNANGTDYYEAYIYLDVTSGTGTVSNSAGYTYFEGHQL